MNMVFIEGNAVGWLKQAEAVLPVNGRHHPRLLRLPRLRPPRVLRLLRVPRPPRLLRLPRLLRPLRVPCPLRPLRPLCPLRPSYPCRSKTTGRAIPETVPVP